MERDAKTVASRGADDAAALEFRGESGGVGGFHHHERPAGGGIGRSLEAELSRASAIDKPRDQAIHLSLDRRESHGLEQLDARGGGVGDGNGRRPRLEAPRAPRPVEGVDTEREGVHASEPSRDQRLEPLDELAAHVQERHSGRSKQVFQRARDHEVDAEGMDVERAGSGSLIVVEHHVGAARVGDFDQARDIEPVSVAEAHVRRGHDEGTLIDMRGIALDGQGFAVRRHPGDAGPALLLGDPHVGHGREFEVSQHHGASVGIEGEGGRDGGDGRRSVRHHRDLVGVRADRGGEPRAQAIDLPHPGVPRRSAFAPGVGEGGERLLHVEGERSLRTAVHVDPSSEDGKAGPELVEGQRHARGIPRRQPGCQPRRMRAVWAR